MNYNYSFDIPPPRSKIGLLDFLPPMGRLTLCTFNFDVFTLRQKPCASKEVQPGELAEKLSFYKSEGFGGLERERERDRRREKREEGREGEGES